VGGSGGLLLRAGTHFSAGTVFLKFSRPEEVKAMMKTLLIGVAAAGLVGVTTAAAQSSSSQTGTTATASAGNELSGEVKKVDKDKQSVKISSPTGGEQELKVASGATITRDGTQASLDQLKEGDQVRASFDPSSKQATKLEVQSKDMKDKQGSSKTDGKSDSQSKSDSKKY